jgi:hypothetical protein
MNEALELAKKELAWLDGHAVGDCSLRAICEAVIRREEGAEPKLLRANGILCGICQCRNVVNCAARYCSDCGTRLKWPE